MNRTLLLAVAALSACSSPPAPPAPRTPPAILDRLTVKHRWDPATGLIVSEEVVALPEPLRDAPSLADAVARSRATGVPVAAFTTADRCAVCQQFKLSTLNDPRLVEFLAEGRVIGVHVEVDRDGEAAKQFLGDPAIPATYLLTPGQPPRRLAGLRNAEQVIEFLSGKP
jgi:thiol:disulfide interchange protein